MKGTLFSADLVQDSSGDLKLLEVNTDTAFASTSSLDYTEFKNIITNLIQQLTFAVRAKIISSQQ